jgi:hypothetical protein
MLELSKKQWLYVGISGAALVAVGIGAGYMIRKNNTPKVTTTLSTPTSSATTTSSVTATASPTATPSTSSSPSLKSLDATWNIYTNPKLGFSINLPKQVSKDASCEATQSNGATLYKVKTGLINLKTFEDASVVYIRPEFYIESSGGNGDASNLLFTNCKKTTTTLALAKDTSNTNLPQGFAIKIASAANDADIDKFIKSEYGKGCSFDAKSASKQAGTFDVKIKGDGKSLEDTECPINYITVLKYSPTQKALAKWDVGQEFVFVDSNNKPYDSDINDSFKFN